MLSSGLRSTIEAALSRHWHTEVELRSAQSVGGGCISNATRVTTASGQSAFLKWAERGELPSGIFNAESQALRALAATHAVRVPLVIAEPDAVGEFEWLLLEWLEPAPVSSTSWRRLGVALAELHRCSSTQFGWGNSNFIGSLLQANEWHRDWPEFWRSQRLLPQLERATQHGALEAAERHRFDALLDELDDLLGAGNSDGPSLLHGDLWSGNVHGTVEGAALIDPSIYYGHREVDLAMAALFGGFGAAFYQAYNHAWPLEPWSERRRHVYQLYYLLVHVNLFGGSYLASALSAVRQLGF